MIFMIVDVSHALKLQRPGFFHCCAEDCLVQEQFTVAPWPAETELQSQMAKRACKDSACWIRQRRLQNCIMSSVKIAISILQNPISTETH
jgi:hypothetical protein